MSEADAPPQGGTVPLDGSSTPPQAGSPPPAVAVPKEGDLIAGKFLVQRVLGRGGMGVVVAAENVVLRQPVAVKFLLPEAVTRAGSLERFLREARAAVMIQSEHVARVFDVGTLESGSPYMVMELLSGSDLGELVHSAGRLPMERAVDYVLQACEAIAEAHSHGIIHRDLKPANLFLTQRTDGSSLVKVLDFGLAKRYSPDSLDGSLTQANTIMGSPFYMSPEQIRSLKAIDSRSDVWSLGVILYQLISGARPFDAPSLGALFLAIGADPAVPIKERFPEVPDGLAAAIMHCLEKDPAQRTQSVSQLARAIAPFGSPESAISVERICRLLPDGAVRGTSSDGNSSIVPLSSLTGSQPSPRPSSLPPVPQAEVAARSSSMQAVTKSAPAALAPAGLAPATPAKGRGALLGVGAVALIGLGVVAFSRFSPGPAATPALSAAPLSATTDLDTTVGQAAPAPSVAPSVASAVASAVAPAGEVSATPSASATASPGASASASAGKPKLPVMKKKDPLDRRR